MGTVGGVGDPAAPKERLQLPCSRFCFLSCLVHPKLASAGTFRALKEPLAFLRSLELVSSCVWHGEGDRGRKPSGEARSRWAHSARSTQSLVFSLPRFNPAHFPGAIPGSWGGLQGLHLEAVKWMNFLRSVISPGREPARRGCPRKPPGEMGREPEECRGAQASHLCALSRRAGTRI